MSRHDDSVSMRQMLEHGCEAVRMAQGRTRDDLKVDRMLQLALTIRANLPVNQSV